MNAELLGLEFVGEGRQLAAQVDQILIAFGPVAEEGELLGDVVLRLRGSRASDVHAFIILRRMPTPP